MQPLLVVFFLYSSTEDIFIDSWESGRGRERARTSVWERNINWLLFVGVPTGNQTHNLGMCPDWESNPQSLGVQDNTPTKPPGQGTIPCFLRLKGPGTRSAAHKNKQSHPECIFYLHYATVKMLIYNLEHINHASNFQMLNASLTFMFSSITWLVLGEGGKSASH